MKCTIPEISWHNKDPVLSVDIQPDTEGYYRLASGGTDSHILIWQLRENSNGMPTLDCVSDLTRHQKAVNVVRFSPSGKFLASGDDESVIIIWKQKTDQDPLEFPNEDENNQEQWRVVKTLRGHLEDIYDLSWSADEQSIISGSVDNTAIIWDVKKGHMKAILRDHKSFVQGVAYDPLGQLLATLSSDRICRVFNATTQKVISRIAKATIPGSKPESKPAHLFHDDTMKSFFRRLCFSPCGSLIIAPAGIIEPQEPGQKAVNTTLVFTRNSLSRPVAYLPSYNQYSVAVRCCPKLFALKDSGEPPLFNLPYRIIFAIATQSSVLLYDSQHYSPFAYIANIHYTRLTDLTWSSDGKILIVSSTDGYCSIITFSEGELGEVYIPNISSKTNIGSESNDKLEATDNKTTNISPDHIKSEQNSEKDKESCRKKLDSEVVEKMKSVKLKTPNDNSVKKSANKSSRKQESTETNNDDDYCLVLEETVTNDISMKSDVTKPIQENAVSNCNAEKSSNPQKEITELNNQSLSFHEININEKPKLSGQDKLAKSEKDESTAVPNSNKNTEPSTIDTTVTDDMHKLNVTPSKNNCPSPVSIFNKNTTPPHNITPIDQRKPKRAQLITLSSPKSKKKL